MSAITRKSIFNSTSKSATPQYYLFIFRSIFFYSLLYYTEWEEERRLPKHPDDVVEVSTASNNQDSRPHTTSGLKCSMRKIDEECLGEVGKPMSEESGSRPTSTSSSSCGKPMVGYHGTMIGEALERQRKDKGVYKK